MGARPGSGVGGGRTRGGGFQGFSGQDFIKTARGHAGFRPAVAATGARRHSRWLGVNFDYKNDQRVANLSGVFDTLQVAGFDPDIAFTVSYLGHGVVYNATVVPAPLPAAAVLFASGLLGLFGTARCRAGEENRV